MKKIEYQFCMSQFKPAIIALSVLIILVMVWSMWNYEFGKAHRRQGFGLAAAQTAMKPPASNIRVRDKMRHPYWGNCNKCHITVDVPNKAVSQVFAGPPIKVNEPQPHKYWGNCNLCHQVSGGFQLPGKTQTRLAAAVGGPPPISADAVPPHGDRGACNMCHQIIAATAPPGGRLAAGGVPGPVAANAKAPHADWGACNNCHEIIQGGGNTAPVAMTRVSAASLGLELQNVNSAIMRQYGLTDEEGVLILAVEAGSVAEQAGLQTGDEITMVNNSRVHTANDILNAVNQAQTGKAIKIKVLRGKRGKNIFLRLPAGQPAAMMAPAPCPTNNNSARHRLNYQVPPAQPVRQLQPLAVQMPNSGRVVICAMGPGLNDQIAADFEASPYFFIYDPDLNRYHTVANPNYNDLTGNGIQASHFMIDLDAVNVMAGDFSVDSFNILKSLHLNVYSGVTGSVREALALYRQGRVQPSVYNGNAVRLAPPATPAPPRQTGVFF